MKHNAFAISHPYSIMDDNFQLDFEKLRAVLNIMEKLAIKFNNE